MTQTEPESALDHFRTELKSAEGMVTFLRGEIVKKEEPIGVYKTKINHLKAAIAALEAAQTRKGAPPSERNTTYPRPRAASRKVERP